MDYLDGTKKAIAFIEANLQGDLSPESVAGEIGFSEFHFHRIFKAMTGETIAEHIRKRRLALAARRLLSSDQPIIEIALEARFESQESFTRAFKKMFGGTPNSYRKSGIPSPIVGKEVFLPELLIHLRNGVNMEPKIVDRGEELVVGMADSFHEGEHKEIGELWPKFMARVSEIHDTKSGYTLGVCAASHPDVKLQDGDTFVYIAAMPVKDLENPPKGMVAMKIPASKYAVFTHKGPISELPHTIRYIWGTWVPRNSDRHKKNAPDLEIYDERFNPKTLDGEFDIYVPINN